VSVEHVLVVAATAGELAAPDGWIAHRCGVGPVDAAASTAAAIAAHRPRVVLHVGIAGARRASGIGPLAVVIGDASVYCDLDVPEAWAPRRLEPLPALVAAAARALPAARRAAIGTSGRVGGTSGCDVESMEGFAVLRAAALAGVPAIEVRAISNAIEEADRSEWRIDDACAAIVAATPALVAELAACVK
jgi:nucleoside phosphorylase